MNQETIETNARAIEAAGGQLIERSFQLKHDHIGRRPTSETVTRCRELIELIEYATNKIKEELPPW